MNRRDQHETLLDVPGLVPPEPRGEELRWFEAAAEGRLLLTRCDRCGARSFPLRAVCPACGSTSTTDEASSGSGTVHSYTVQYRRQRPDVPIPNVVALVDLDEGPRLMTRLVMVEPADVHIGMAVETRFARCGDLGVPVFVPVGSSDA
jgi:uncharacterized OB-fold protein